MNDKNLGLGVLIHMFGGNEKSIKKYKKSIGKKITGLEFKNKQESEDFLLFTFEDSSTMKVYDDGQSCCEARYMVTDDDLTYYIGAELMSMELRDVPEEEDKYGEIHEIQFLIVNTSKGSFTMSNHNEHNGYYGGFSVVCA